MVKRSVKYSLGILAVVIVALLIIPFFIDANSYKPQIAKMVKDATGRQLQIGNIEASLFPWVGVRLEDVHLANRAGFSERDFLKVASLDVRVALLPLLSKEIEIKQFKLEAPELFLERNAEGEGNWGDLTAPAAAPEDGAAEGETAAETARPAADKPATALAALNAESLQLKGGRFVWADAVTKGHAELSDITVEINDVQLERPIEATASLRSGEDKIELSARFGPLGDVSKLDPMKLPLQATLASESLGLAPFAAFLPELPELFGKKEQARLRINIQLEQRPDGLRLSAGEVAMLAATTAEAKWKAEMRNAKTVRLQDLSIGLNGRSLMHAEGEVRLENRLRYSLKIKGEPVEREWLATLLPELKSMYAGHPAPWQQLKLGAWIDGSSDRLDLKDVQLTLDREIVQASGVASFDKAPDIRLRVASRELHLDPWLSQPKQQKKPASVESELATVSAKSQEPDLRAFKGWRVSSEMQVQKLHLRGLELTHLRASLNGSGGIFKLDPLSFDLSGGHVTETASLNLSTYPVKWTESVNMSGVSVGPVLKAVAGLDMLEGVLQMSTSLKATGLLPDNSMRSLNGRGSVTLRDGSIKGFDIAGTLRNLTASGQGEGTKKTDFAQLSGNFTITNGIVKNDDLFMASPLFRLNGNGVVNLPRGTLDYHVKPRLVGTLVGQGDTVTVRKGLSVPLRIRGPFAALRITPEIDPATLIENIGAVKGGSLKGLTEAITGKQTQEQQPAEQQPAQQPAEQKPRPEQQIQKALEGLLGR